MNTDAAVDSKALLEQLLEGDAAVRYQISALTVTVASGAGQSASTRWDQDRGTL